MSLGLLPFNEEYEQLVLGALLAQSSNFELIDELEVTDFYLDKHRLIFSAFKRMNDQSIPIDVVTLRNELEQKGVLDDAGGVMYLTYLTELVLTGLNYEYYVGEIKKASILRKKWEDLHRAAKAIEEGMSKEDINDLLLEISHSELSYSKNSLKPYSAQELENIPPPQSLWGEIIYEASITLINSLPGVGKTTLCYNLCAFGSLNQEFLELAFSKPIKVLYLDAETHRGIRKRKIENICGELPLHFYFWDIGDFKKEYSKLLSQCKSDKYDIVVLDTLSRLIGFENENDNAEANNIMGLIRRLTIVAGCSIIIVHHTSKSEDTKGVYKGRGASAIPAAADVVVNLEELDEDTLKLKVEKNRLVGNKTELCLKKVGEDRFEPHYLANSQKSGFEIFEAQNLILSMPPNEELRTNQICEYGIDEGFNKRTMERAISGLTQSGKLKRLKKGVYTILKDGVSDSSDSSARHNPDGIVGLADSVVDTL